MKNQKQFIVSVCLFLISLSPVFGQNKEGGISKLGRDNPKLHIEYYLYNGYLNDSVYTSKSLCDLYLGEDGSVFTIHLITNRESENKEQGLQKQFLSQISSSQSLSPNEQTELAKQFNSHYHSSQRMNDNVMFKLYGDKLYYSVKFSNNKYAIIKDTADFIWSLKNEYKKIGDYKCQAAAALANGDTATAWFTDSIPINAGPAFIYGLPGLIMEYCVKHSDGTVFYRIKSISSENADMNGNPFASLPVSASVMSKKEFEAQNLRDFQNAIKLLNNLKEKSSP